MEVIKPFDFGDKYEEDGNDYHLLNHKYIIPHRITPTEKKNETTLLFSVM